MNNIVEIENLTKDYEVGFWRKKKVRALEGLTLTVAPGQIFGFLGGNGAGKTTTIKILMGLLFPTSGTARILGSDIADVSMHRRIGYCPENPYFYDYLTASELMKYFGELFGLSQNERTRRTAELLAKVGLDEKDWNKQLRKFSKGMLQRVGLAQALVNEPEIVFFDEPMSGLDPIGRREIRELIIELREKGTTVFMSTHILSDVEALCDEVAILRGGKLTATGNLDDLLATQGDRQTYEVSLKNVKAAQLSNSYITIPNAAGVTVHVGEETEVEKVLSEARAAGGKLVSVQIVRQSLEELFVEASEKKDSTDATPPV
ncbi:MAG TPA: ABC transporter ATP-binding protein [Pyrinomonadaceae bacterium]|nr:ABC transporter ATP-binding protein [Pyrinomonadaceae bacterium]